MSKPLTTKRSPSRPRAKASSHGVGERYRTLVNHLPVGVYRTTPEGTFVEANPALLRMLGYKQLSSLLSRNVKDFYVKRQDRSEHLKQLARVPTFPKEFELRRADGRRFWVRDHCRAIKSPSGEVMYLDGILVDITERITAERKLERALRELQSSNKKLESLILTDELTGLYNRRGFFTLGLQEMKIAKRLKKQIYLLFLDIDDLKFINDTQGHPAGDQVLQGVAAILKGTLRESDLVARIGGDEFAILAMRAKGSGERSLLARIEAGIRSFRLNKFRRFRLSVSMGVVRVDPRKYSQLEDFLAHADFLMYQQKRKKEAALP
jgi:diguanylate cyclase (GGDEF)-like protein/PAS domain S-box-containing protein